MAKRPDDQLLKGDRVRSVDDLPGVPGGTLGKVILTNGLEWKRYRVLFETDAVNGTDVGSLDREQLIRVDKKGQPVAAGS